MSTVDSRALCDDSRALLGRVGSGEHITIMVDGHPAAVLGPVEPPRRWITRSELLAALEDRRADPALAAVLMELVPDTTDDLDW